MNNQTRHDAMQRLLRSSVSVYSSIRDAFSETIECCRQVDPVYARYSAQQMHYYSSRCQAMNTLLQQWMLWDCDIIFRSALECATRFLFVSTGAPSDRHELITEYKSLLGEIEDIHRSEKALIAAKNSDNASDAMLFKGAAVSPEREKELRLRWPKSKKRVLKQKWSFSEIVRVLEKINAPALDLRSYGSLLHSYGLSSHLIHADQTAMILMHDRASRNEKEKALLERAHFARLAVQQTSLFFICWRAMDFSVGRAPESEGNISIYRSLTKLHEDERIYHEEFADSQKELYAHFNVDSNTN